MKKAWLALPFLLVGCGSADSTPAEAPVNGPKSTLRFEPETIVADTNVRDCKSTGLPSPQDVYQLSATGRSWSAGASGEGIPTRISVSASPPFERNVPLELVSRNVGVAQEAQSAGEEPVFTVAFRHGASQWEIASTEIHRGRMAVLDLDRTAGAPFRVHVELELSTGETIDVTLSAPLALAACTVAG